MKVVPPNFGNVEEHIYRCGAPQPRHYGFLSSLHLKTCVLLTDTHDESFVRWLQECGIAILCPLSTPDVDDEGSGEEAEGGGVPKSPGGGGAQPLSPPPLIDDSLEQRGHDEEDHYHHHRPSSPGGVGSSSGGGGDVGTRAVEGGSGDGGGAASVEPDLSRHNSTHTFTSTVAYQGTSRAVSAAHNSPFQASAEVRRDGGSALRATPVPGARPSNVARFLQENIGDKVPLSVYTPVSEKSPGFPLVVAGARVPSHRRMQLYLHKAHTVYGSGCGRHGQSGVSSRGLMTLSEPVVVDILHVLLDPENYPLLMTCSKGRYRTGIVCACLRKLQRWNLVSILEEYRRYAGDKSRADNEEFVELFDKDLVSLELPGGRRPTILYDM